MAGHRSDPERKSSGGKGGLENLPTLLGIGARFRVEGLGRGVASLRLSGGRLEGSGAGEEDSYSNSRLKSSWSLRGRLRGEEEEVEVEEEEWGRLLGGRLLVA